MMCRIRTKGGHLFNTYGCSKLWIATDTSKARGTVMDGVVEKLFHVDATTSRVVVVRGEIEERLWEGLYYCTRSARRGVTLKEM